MISFRGYLQERAPAWTESLSTALFDLTRTDIMIPLSPSILKRIWPKLPRTTVFHLTDLVGVQRLKKMQGGKRSISAFWNIEHRVLQDGIRTDGGYVVELEGDILAAGPDDIMSQPDKTGRRWLTLSTLLDPVDRHGMGGGVALSSMENDIEVSIAPRSNLLETDVDIKEKLYGYHRLEDPVVTYLKDGTIQTCKWSEVVKEETPSKPQMIDRNDLPPEPEEY